MSVGCEPKPPRAPPAFVDPDMTMSKLVPMAAKVSSTWLLAPSPMATMAMTAPTPMMMPSAVRKLRNLLRSKARPANRVV